MGWGAYAYAYNVTQMWRGGGEGQGTWGLWGVNGYREAWMCAYRRREGNVGAWVSMRSWLLGGWWGRNGGWCSERVEMTKGIWSARIYFGRIIRE